MGGGCLHLHARKISKSFCFRRLLAIGALSPNLDSMRVKMPARDRIVKPDMLDGCGAAVRSRR